MDSDEQIGVKKTVGRKPKGRKKSTTTTAKTTKSTKKTAGKGRKAKNFLDSDSEEEQQHQIEPTTTNNKKQKLNESIDLKNSLVVESSNELFKKLDNLSTSPSISTQIFTATSRTFKVPLHENKPLNWSHKINLIGEKSLEQRIHLCDICKEPILFYGRLIPCKHVFCFDCAIEIQEKNSGCLRCNERIVRIERNNLNSMYMCNHDKQCKRTYLSQRDLLAHTQHRHTKKEKSNSSSEKSLKLRTNSSFNDFQSSSFANANQQKSNNGHHSIHYPQPSLHTLQWTQALAAASSNTTSGQPFIPPNTRFSGTSTPSSGWPNQNRNYYP